MSQPILLTHWRSPGDIICMTAAVRDLALTYPGRFEIHVGGACSEVWEGNPHIAGNWAGRLPRRIPRYALSYEAALARSNQVKLHFLTAFHRSLELYLAVPLHLLKPYGDLHLLPHERASRPLAGRYWLLISGGKTSIRAKIWPQVHSQRLVDLLRRRGINIVQVGASFPGHEHHRLRNIVNLVGQTSLRDVLRLIFHSEGVICPVTFAMHAAAAFEKPCVVIAGGREPWWWEAYIDSAEHHFGLECSPLRVPHRFLHSQGQLECCRSGGCWKTDVRCGSTFGPHDCVLPVEQAGGPAVPRCLASVSPELVEEAVLSYYRDETLSLP